MQDLQELLENTDLSLCMLSNSSHGLSYKKKSLAQSPKPCDKMCLGLRRASYKNRTGTGQLITQRSLFPW